MKNTRWALIALTVLGMVATVPITAGAATITFDLNYVFSGGTPSGYPKVTLTDVAGGVEVKVDTTGLSGEEFLDDLYLNFLGDTSLLSDTYLSGVMANGVLYGDNSFKADGDGYFDIMFDYPPPGTVFGADMLSTYLLSGATTAMFDATSFCQTGCGTGSYYAAAHVQALSGGLSTWVGDPNGGGPPPPPPPPTPVPEPASMMLMGTGMLAFAAKYRKKIAALKGQDQTPVA